MAKYFTKLIMLMKYNTRYIPNKKSNPQERVRYIQYFLNTLVPYQGEISEISLSICNN